MKRLVAYYRVSTQDQGRSGLGLAAQRRAVAEYIARAGGELIGELEEIESGKNDTRPRLAEAITRSQLTGATLVIAKLDRLSRDIHFLTGLERQGVRFVACDMPDANELTVHIMAAVAQQERQAIASRTTAALATIKAKLAAGEKHVSRRSGKPVERLGNPNGLRQPRPDLGTQAARKKADDFARKLSPILQDLQGKGTSLHGMAKALTDMKVQTPRGGEVWTAMGVRRALQRVNG